MALTSLLVRILGLGIILGAVFCDLAGRLDWLQGWLFTLAYTGFLTIYGVQTSRNDPDQLKERSRTAFEDRTLQQELPGYREYAQRVRYRLLPGVW